MENQGVRAGSLAVRTHGELRLSSGYTFAEADYSDTRPDSLFRLASVSKAFAAAAIHRRSDGGSLTWTRRCSSSSVALPGQTKDPRVDAITIQPIATTPADEIATRPASIRSSKAATSPEPWNCPTGVTKHDVAHYMYGEPLHSDPGTVEVYSNLGYPLMGLVAEEATGTDFTEFVQTEILPPLGVEKQVPCGRTLEGDALDGEVAYDPEGTGLSAWDPYSDEEGTDRLRHLPHRRMRLFRRAGGHWCGCHGLIGEYAVWGLWAVVLPAIFGPVPWPGRAAGRRRCRMVWIGVTSSTPGQTRMR